MKIVGKTSAQAFWNQTQGLRWKTGLRHENSQRCSSRSTWIVVPSDDRYGSCSAKPSFLCPNRALWNSRLVAHHQTTTHSWGNTPRWQVQASLCCSVQTRCYWDLGVLKVCGAGLFSGVFKTEWWWGWGVAHTDVETVEQNSLAFWSHLTMDWALQNLFFIWQSERAWQHI